MDLKSIHYKDLHRKQNKKVKFYRGYFNIIEDSTIESEEELKALGLENDFKVGDTIPTAKQTDLDHVTYIERVRNSYRFIRLKDGDTFPDTTTIKPITFSKLRKKIDKMCRALKSDSLLLFGMEV